MKSIEVEVIGLLPVADMFIGVSTRLKDDTEVMRSILDRGRESVTETFLAQGRPMPWEDLAPSTLRKRQARGNFSPLILRDTDETYLSFIGEGNEWSILEVENHRATWGNRREDFAYHHDGTPNEPQRQILQHLPDDQELYAQMYLDFIVEPFEVV